jgi:tetratricopeptide (TPR) repeat protein
MTEPINYFVIYKSKNYSKVVADLLPSALEGKNFDVKNLNMLIDSLNKLKRFDEAVDIGKKFIEEVKENSYALGSFCFSVYMAKFLPNNKEQTIKSATIKTAEWLIAHAKKDPTYFVYLNPLLMVVEYHIVGHNFARAKQLLGDILPEQLKTERGEIMVDGKKVSLKSDKMKFLKLKFELAKGEKEFETALSIINQLIEIDPWDTWYKREKAIILVETGHIEESVNIYMELISRRKEWFLYHEVAKLALKMNRNEDAQKFFSRAYVLADKQSPHFTWHLFIDIAKFLETMGKEKEAKWHLDYVFHSAINDEGNKPQEMLKYFQFLGYKPDPQPNIPDIKNKIQNFHSSYQFDSQQLVGVISKVIGGGKSGFVLSGDKSYFFSSRDFKGKTPIEGMEVTFHTETKVNHKTKNEELHAVGLKIR